MNGFHLAHFARHLAEALGSRRIITYARFHVVPILRRFAGLPRPQRWTISVGLVVLGLIVLGQPWFHGTPRRTVSNELPYLIYAARTDAPSRDQASPELPEYLSRGSSVASQAGTSLASDAASVKQADVRSPEQSVATTPSIVTGPELFTPTIQPDLAAKKQPLSIAPFAGRKPTLPNAGETPTPPQFFASWPGGPPPMSAVAPIPAQLPASRPVRSETLEKIAVQSDQQVRHGFELADRGAYFAARAEFTTALRLIAQGLDNEENTTVHCQALTAALTAMKEAQEFIPTGGKLEGELDLPTIVASHRTPVLKNVPRDQLQAMRALKQYFTFAQQQLALAAGQEVSASMALGALGKMHSALAGKPNPEIVAPDTKAVVFFQAAILACPRNYMAANDLGVLLAHSGDYAGARRLLEHSVLVCRCAENLNNLSVVYRQAGQQRLAELAAEKAQVAKVEESARQKNASLSAGGTIEWVNPAALAQSPGQWADPAPRPATASPNPAGSVASPAAPFAPTTR